MFARIEGTRQFRMMADGLGQYWLGVYCADGSYVQHGPFERGEEAIQCQHDLEHPEYDDTYEV